MAQRLNYTILPNTPDKAYLSTINRVLGHVSRTPMQFKQMREWLRDNQLWDKEQTPAALELMGVQLKPTVGLTELGAALLQADGDAKQRRVLFRALRDCNVLLAKFVLEALDPETGGRLHSTYELHRLLTSYVYPGKHISLPDFQAWIKWMTACEGIRLIGIRWGLGEVGSENLEWFRARDAEEILEDETDDDDDEPVGAVVQSAGSGAAASAPVVAAPAKASRSNAAAEDDFEDEDLPDMPPEASAPEDAVVDRYLEELEPAPPRPSPRDVAQAAAAAARAVPGSASAAYAHAAAVHPMHPTAAPGGYGLGLPRALPHPVDAAALAATAQWIQAWWMGWPDRAECRLHDYGLDPQIALEPAGLGACAFAAVAATSGIDGAVTQAWLRPMVESGLVARYFAGECTLDEWLVDAVGAGSARASRLSELLVHASSIRARIDRDRGVAAQAKAWDDGPRAVRALVGRVFGESHAVAAFWLVRELHRAEVWPNAGLRTAAAVVDFRLRENAYRLGFTDALYAEDLDALLALSGAVATHFGADTGFGAALAQLPQHLGCSFRCGRTATCPLACREKFER